MVSSRRDSVQMAHTRPRIVYLLGIILILGSAAAMAPARVVLAQTADEAELIRLINELRASRGLAAYTVDPGLMALAQEHSAYQASIHTSTHLHSDGRNPPQIGVVENVAGGDLGYLTPQTAIYDIWVMDAGHLKTMVGFANGAMGVGIADDGVTSYYTLDVRPGGTTAKTSTTIDARFTQTPYTPIPLVPLVTMTARSDGTVIHVVGYGQTLWSIALAYGVQVEQIRAWNNLAEGSDAIYAGQKLLVRPSSLVTLIPVASGMAVTPMPTLTVDETPPPTSPTATAADPSLAATTLVNPVIEEEGATQSIAPEHSMNLLLPSVAGTSILVGCALLAILLLHRNKEVL